MGSILNAQDLLRLPVWAQKDIEGLLAQNRQMRERLSLGDAGSDTIARLPSNHRRGRETVPLGNAVVVEFGGIFGARYRADTQSLTVWRLAPTSEPRLGEGLTVSPFSHRKLIIRKDQVRE